MSSNQTSENYQIRLSGEGGQGVILGGRILADAAILHEQRYAVQSPTYGSRVRGGPTKVDVIISNQEILYPRATQVNFFLSLAQTSYEKYCENLADQAYVLMDENLTTPCIKSECKVLRFPFVQTARSNLGNILLSNIIAIAALVSLTQVVSEEALWEAIQTNVPAKYLDLNRRAMELGFEWVDGLDVKAQ